ncbi:PREDICTED: uncharacterized protein LOC108766440 [Trachymyrmex cornetzi]|uniref:uncharacterized protein LOC108766440 n=1 Tax=Trachymyrmex cornetzi TaxID=471704 RepID=UPI00084F71DC|nr:PREDICTED: uncharacterized protein LOC108766440 [Trachymyrmex cornetzi]
MCNTNEEFIKIKLQEWNLSKWYDRFIEEDIDKETFLTINETEVAQIISTIGGICCFLEKRKLLIESIKDDSHQTSDNVNQSAKLFSNKNEQLWKPLTTKTESLNCEQRKNKESIRKKSKPEFSKLSCSNASTYTKEHPTCKEILNTTFTDSSDAESSHSSENCSSDSSDVSNTKKANIDSSLNKSDKKIELKKINNGQKLKTTSRISPYYSNSATIENVKDLKELLLSSIDGHIIVKFYEKHDILDEAKRRKLTELFVTQFMFKKSVDTIEM